MNTPQNKTTKKIMPRAYKRGVTDTIEQLQFQKDMYIEQGKLQAQAETQDKVEELKEMMKKVESEEGDYEDVYNIVYGEIDKIFGDKLI